MCETKPSSCAYRRPNKQRILFAALLAAMMARLSADPEAMKLRLSDALAAASNQPVVLQAQAQVAAARQREALARCAYLPTLSASASYARVEPQDGLELDFRPHLNIDIKAPTSTENMMNFKLAASELIYDFGQREAQLRLASAGLDFANVGLDQARTSVAYATARAFDAAFFLREERKVLKAQLASLEKHREDAEVRERTGSCTHYDVLATEVRMASVKSQLIDVGVQYAKQMIELKRLTGIKGVIDLVGDIEPRPSELDPKAAMAEAVASRDDLRQSVAAERQAAIRVDVARSGNRPTLSTQAQAGYRNGILTYDNTDVDKLMFNWSLGVSLNVPIYDAGQAARKTGEALAEAEAASSGRADRELTVKAQVLQAIEDAAACHEQTANSLAQLAQAQEALSIAEVQYSVGAATNLQYLDAQTELELAQLSKLGASYREVLSGLALNQVLGKKLP